MEHELAFKKILLATDGTPQAEAAVDATIQLARYTTATVRVLHVWSREELGDAEHLVRDTVERLTRAGVMAEQEVFRADADLVPDAIAATARQIHADLVVIGSRGLSDWQSLFRHSVSHQVMAAVDCPVLVVREAPRGSFSYKRRIMIAVAGGEDVKPAVNAALALAQPMPSVAMVAHVAQAIFGAQGFAYVESEEEITATIEAACMTLREGGVPVETKVVRSGRVADELAQLAFEWDADVIVTGSGRMRDLAGFVFGSVSHDLMHKSDVPVLVAERVKD